MRQVLMVSTSYPRNSSDWRGRFISDMATAVAQQPGIRLELWSPPGEIPEMVSYAANQQEAAWLDNLAGHGGIAQWLRRRSPFAIGPVLGLLKRLRKLYHRTTADVLHINWLQNALPLIGLHHPALITVLGSDYALLRWPGMCSLLRCALRGRRAILAPNAAWMQPVLEEKFGDLVEVRTISFGIDKLWFDVKHEPESQLGWLMALRITRQKMGRLFDWGPGYFTRESPLHLFGPMQEDIALPEWIHWHGPSHPDALRSEWFPRAQGLITLSMHDEGRPQVILEAMAAGLPVIASDIPAHRDMIQHGETGWLAGNAEVFVEGLMRLENADYNHTIGEAGRRQVRQNPGTWQACAERYLAAYRNLLEPVA